MLHAILLTVILACAHENPAQLTVERALSAGPSFSAYLISYQSAGLKLHAMVAVPTSEMPIDGYPLVIANHGFVPDPRKYGITADGVDSRPGDYYRSVPELYASRGFMVVIPDYRGHNSSEGYDQIAEQNHESVSLYAEDVVALMAVIGEIEQADTRNVFMWSHSMGGGVAMRVLLATNIVKAASFWATRDIVDLTPHLVDLDESIIIQHSLDDSSTAYSNSRNLSKALHAIGHPHTLYSYESDDHYFKGEIRELAADRDAAFFRLLIGQP